MNELPLAAAELIPHREEMLLVDELSSYDADSGHGLVRATGRNDSAFSRNQENRRLEPRSRENELEEIVLLEMMAQAYACLRGYRDRLAGRPPSLGFLVGVRRWGCRQRPVGGQRLEIRVHTAARVEAFYIAAARIFAAGKLLAEGELKLWIPPDGEAGER